MIKLKYVEFHQPLFLGGRNFQSKVGRADIEMYYDRKEKELTLVHNGITAIMPYTSVVLMVPGEPEVSPAPKAITTGKPVKAQASLPPGMREE